MVERPVCFVLHGGPVIDHSYFRPWMDPMGEFMQLIYVDYRGTGRSQRMPHDTYTRDHTIADLDALRQHLGLEKIAVLGHSHGGFLAQLYALDYPQHVSHVILVATSAYTGPEHEEDSEANLDQLMIDRPDLARKSDAFRLTNHRLGESTTEDRHVPRTKEAFQTSDAGALAHCPHLLERVKPACVRNSTGPDPLESRAGIGVDPTPFCVRVTIQMDLRRSSFSQLSCGRSSAREMM